MADLDYSKEFELLARAYAASGGNPDDFKNNQLGMILISGNKTLLTHEIPGLIIESKDLPDGVKAHIRVKKGHQVKFPIHLCFGVVTTEGVQRILADFTIEDNASAHFIAHCSFPSAVHVQHIMEGTIVLGKNSKMIYDETHFHGPEGGVEVLPKMKIEGGEASFYSSTFKLVKGAVGKMDLDYEAHLKEKAVAEMYTKVYGKKKDTIRVKESIYLDGQKSRGLAKSRIVLADESRAEVLGEITGNGPHSRGHVDCMEIIKGDKAVAEAIPKLRVVDETAKLTHEAAIGSVDKRQVQTLMARGLSESDAVDVIVEGLLR